MRGWIPILFGLLIFEAPASALDANLAQMDLVIVLNREVHFTGDDGIDFLAAAGQYLIEPPAETASQILLRRGAETVAPPAVRINHEELIAHPTALLVSDRPDRLHVVVLLPGGIALNAVGYFDGVRPRDVNPGLIGTTQSPLFKQALQQKATSPALSGAISQKSPAALAELQRITAEQQQAKAEMEPAALLARIRALEFILSCMAIEGYGSNYGHALPPPRVYPANRADVRWDGVKCPGM